MMTRPDVRDNPVLVEEERLLIRLHGLIAAGSGDTDEADAVRDEMEAAWWDLSNAEQQLLNGLSGDLYQLNDEEIFAPVHGAEAARAWQSRLQEAAAEERWEEVLALLRKRPADYPSAEVARLRAAAYERLGFPLAAAEFAAYARDRCPAPTSAGQLAAS
jgi:hypothetical protein